MSTQPNGRRRVNRFAADDSDVIVVIGSGAGGGTLASELSAELRAAFRSLR